MYFLGRTIGWQAQRQLWRLIDDDRLVVMDLDRESRSRASAVMEKYRALPADLADASLIALAERLDTRTLFTFDSDFLVYRWKDRLTFHILPEPK